MTDHTRQRIDSCNKRMGMLLWTRLEDFAMLVREWAFINTALEWEKRITGQDHDYSVETRMTGVMDFAQYVSDLGKPSPEPAKNQDDWRRR